MTITNLRTTVLLGAALTLSAAGTFTAATPASAATLPTTQPAAVAVAQDAGVPVHVPVNVCGDTVNGNGGLNPAFGNVCVDK